MAPGAFRKSAAAVSDKPSSADLLFYGITEETYAELVRKFRAVNKDGSGEIGLQVGAWTLCVASDGSEFLVLRRRSGVCVLPSGRWR